MTPQENNRLGMLRTIIQAEHGKHATKEKDAAAAADRQLPVLLGQRKHERRASVDRVAVRALLLEWNKRELTRMDKRQNADGTGREYEELLGPNGVVIKRRLQMSLWEADQVIARRRQQSAGLEFEADFLQALRDRAAMRATEQGIDTTMTLVIIDTFVDAAEAAEVRREMLG